AELACRDPRGPAVDEDGTPGVADAGVHVRRCHAREDGVRLERVGRDGHDPATPVDATPGGLDGRSLAEVVAGKGTRTGGERAIATGPEIHEVEVPPRDLVGLEDELHDVGPGTGATCRAVG